MKLRQLLGVPMWAAMLVHLVGSLLVPLSLHPTLRQISCSFFGAWSLESPHLPLPVLLEEVFSLYPYYHNLIIFLSSLLQLPVLYSYACVNISWKIWTNLPERKKKSLFIRMCSWTTGFSASFWLYRARGGRQCSAISFQLKSPCHLAVGMAATASHLLHSGDSDGSGSTVCLFI